MAPDIALDALTRKREYPSCSLTDNANILVFPALASANIGYKLLVHLGGANSIGPIVVGLNKPANVVATSATVDQIASMIYFTAHQLTT